MQVEKVGGNKSYTTLTTEQRVLFFTRESIHEVVLLEMK